MYYIFITYFGNFKLTLTCQGLVSYIMNSGTTTASPPNFQKKNQKRNFAYFHKRLRNDYPKFPEKNKKQLYKNEKLRLYTFLLRSL